MKLAARPEFLAGRHGSGPMHSVGNVFALQHPSVGGHAAVDDAVTPTFPRLAAVPVGCSPDRMCSNRSTPRSLDHHAYGTVS